MEVGARGEDPGAEVREVQGKRGSIMVEPLTTAGIIALIINGGAMWIREWKKGKVEKGNNKDLKEIRKKTDCIDEKVGHIKTNVATIKTSMDDIKDNCKQTTTRFERAINGNRKEILEIAKDKGK